MSSHNDSRREIRLEESWKRVLQQEFDHSYMQQLRAFLQQRREAGVTIYPPTTEWFNAFFHTPFEQVRVVILGQDPYHGPGQAHGLCFSVPSGVAAPPSLGNIFKELESDLGTRNQTNSLLPWADQGVLLLNSVLTVEAGRAGSHGGKGWERFTDAVVTHLNDQHDHLVFLLWGGYARNKGSRIDRKRHTVIESPHPSPLSAHRGFFGSRPFSRVNEALRQHSTAPIDWTT